MSTRTARHSTVQAPYSRSKVQAERDRTRELSHMSDVVDALRPTLHDATNTVKRIDLSYTTRCIAITVSIADTRTVFIHIQPWMRGLAIFAHQLPLGAVGPGGWRTAEAKLQGLNMPLYNPRNTVGCWHIPVSEVVAQVTAILDPLSRWDKTLRAQLTNQKPSWPNLVMLAMRRAHAR